MGDIGEIKRVKYRYLRALDTKDWDEFADTLTITEHRVAHPEITVNGDEATATWYLQDRVIVPESNFKVKPGAALNI